MNLLQPLLLLPLLFITPSCASVSGSPVRGLIVTNVSIPGESFETADDLQGGVKDFARGEASANSVLGIFAFGDASIQQAAANGQIQKIHHVDYEVFSFIGLYATFTTVVYGQL
jgi:hypothetical protein